MNQAEKYAISASVMCADVLTLGEQLHTMEEAGVGYIHSDIMDNHFVPNLMLPPEWLNKLHEATTIPFDFHLMVDDPESVLDRILLKEGDFVSIHAETTDHLTVLLQKIRERGARPAAAICPETPIENLFPVLPYLDMILVMTVHPGFAGQKMVEGSLEKIQELRTYLDQHGYPQVRIEVDGNCSFANVPKMYRAGADIFVAGTSSIFKKGLTIREGMEILAEGIG